jgi:hypothetical protein
VEDNPLSPSDRHYESSDFDEVQSSGHYNRICEHQNLLSLIHTHTHTHIYIVKTLYVCMYVCMYVYIYIYIYIYIYVHPRTGHEGPEEKYNSTLSLTSALDSRG